MRPRIVLQPTLPRWKVYVNHQVKANHVKACNGLKVFWNSQAHVRGVLVKLHSI